MSLLLASRAALQITRSYARGLSLVIVRQLKLAANSETTFESTNDAIMLDTKSTRKLWSKSPQIGCRLSDLRRSPMAKTKSEKRQLIASAKRITPAVTPRKDEWKATNFSS